MKLTVTQETEVWQVYDTWLTAYLNADVKTYDAYLDDDYHFIGSTNNEEFLKRNDATTFFERTGDQFAGIMDLRNEIKILEVFDTSVFITHFCDVWFINDEDRTYYGRFRLSSVMQKKNEGWRFIYQHFSMPDSKSDEGESIGFDKVNAENIELKEAIKRRTIELENKNRELEIESALERVRSASMAMQESDELASVARTVFEQLRVLGIDVYRSWIDIFHVEEGYVLTWSTDFEGNFQPNPATFPLDFDETMSDFYRDYKSSSKFIELEAHGDDVREWFDYLYSVSSDPIFKMYHVPDDLYQIWAKHKYGTVATTKLSPISNDEKDILNRFANVFEQAYTRFLDLQKAEAQAREAQIEMALEKVRSRTMAMQSSDELTEAATEMFRQIEGLGLNPWSCGFNIFNDDKTVISQWVSTGDGRPIEPFDTPATQGIFKRIVEQSEHDEPLYVEKMEGKNLEDTYKYMASLPTLDNIFEELDAAGIELPKKQVDHAAYFKHGYLMFITYDETPEFHSIFERFANVFEQTYTRFLDLHKAEEQAMEAKIEAALEKVRSRSMGMQSSEELPEVANLMFLEIQNLGINAFSCGYCILEEDRRSSMCIMSTEGTIQKPFLLPHVGEPSFEEWDDFVHSDRTFFTQELAGKSIESHYDFMTSLPQLQPVYQDLKDAGLSLPTYQINHLAKFSAGFLLFITYEPVPEAHDIFKRFTAVFNQTYTRFLDLESSEQRAREAEIELSMERIRAQVTAMQESSDLFDIVVNMRKEFISLGHKADYFWHMHWLPDSYDMSMTSEDGNRIGMVIRIPKFVHDAIPGLAEWEKGSDPIYVLALNAKDAWDYIENMNTHGKYEQADPNAPAEEDIREIGGLTFILARTSHGEIGYSLPGEVPKPPLDALDTLKRFAGVFDLAYQRFEDLQEAEQQARLVLEERDRLEIALNELHATQDQLVQQEKLASLGQLTAGIAHEIKNPLNFVNNFSDLSLELVEEVREEVNLLRQGFGGQESEKETPLSRGEGNGGAGARGVSDGAKDGDQAQNSETDLSSSNTPLSPLSRGEAGLSPDTDLILEILDDIEANLKTIHKHGSRADSIVKSMLQHSRGGDGKMEPTPLNPLIKEYVKLAFHGMRAGNDPINVDIDLQLDESIGEVPLVAEDFSRVILNLVNNAFDAMQGAGHKAQDAGDYGPRLTVRTRSENGSAIIEIEDNGPGIPDEIKDKILQPFFTTKKGTAGTGLGLSITNDIIKAHGGELNIESRPGKGTTFIISIIQQA